MHLPVSRRGFRGKSVTKYWPWAERDVQRSVVIRTGYNTELPPGGRGLPSMGLSRLSCASPMHCTDGTVPGSLCILLMESL